MAKRSSSDGRLAAKGAGWQAPAPHADNVEVPLGSAHSGLRSRSLSLSLLFPLLVRSCHSLADLVAIVLLPRSHRRRRRRRRCRGLLLHTCDLSLSLFLSFSRTRSR